MRSAYVIDLSEIKYMNIEIAPVVLHMLKKKVGNKEYPDRRQSRQTMDNDIDKSVSM